METAEKWRADGAEKLHIIDLDAAFGTGNNLSVIAEIAEKVALPIQVGGGIREHRNCGETPHGRNKPGYSRRFGVQ